MSINYHLKMQGTLLEDVNGGVSLQKAAQVRLDNLAQIKARCTFINDPARLGRLRDRLELQRSLGDIEDANRRETAQKKDQEKAELQDILPEAIRMHMAGLTEKRTFTKAHAKSILLLVFESSPAASRRKTDLVDDLKAMEEKHPDCLMEAAEKFLDVLSENASPAVPPSANGQTTSEVETATAVNDNSNFVADGIRMYLANETKKRAFSKDHIKAILVSVFKHTPARTAKKTELLDELNNQVETSPGLLPTAVAAAAAVAASLPPLVAVAAVAADNAPPLPPTQPIESPPVQPLQAAPTASNPNAHWFYCACKDAVVTMRSPLTPLQLALVIYKKLLDTMESDWYDDDDEDGGVSKISIELFSLFRGQPDKEKTVAKKRDVNFIHAVSERASDIIYDKECNENALRDISLLD